MPFERRRLERRRDNESLDVAGISSWHSKHSSGVGHGHVLSDYRPSRAQIGFTICRNRSHWIFPHVRRCADADLGGLGDLVQLIACPVQQEWTALVLFRIAPDADSVRRCLCSLVKTYQPASNPGGKKGRKPQQWSRATGLVDRSLNIRVPPLVVSLLAQGLLLLVAS